MPVSILSMTATMCRLTGGLDTEPEASEQVALTPVSEEGIK